MQNDIKVYRKNKKTIAEKTKMDIFFTDYYYPKYSIHNNGIDQYIEDFKNGLNVEEYAEVFSNAIKKIFYHSKASSEKIKEFLKTVTIVPVPASNEYRHNLRYRKLFEIISEKTGVRNGFKVIEVRRDKEISHFNKNTRDYNNYIVNYRAIKKPYRIIYIDDVIARGETIRLLNGKVFDVKEYQYGMKTGLYKNESNFMFSIALCLKKSIHDDFEKLDDILVEDNTGFLKQVEDKFELNILTNFFYKKYEKGKFYSVIGNSVKGIKDCMMYISYM